MRARNPCRVPVSYTHLDVYKRQGLEAALRAAETFSYLPLEGKDFMLRDVRVKFGDGIVGWKAMVPPSLTEDTETALVEAFYMDGARFAVL